MVKIAATLFVAATACLLLFVPTFADDISACDSCECAKTECNKYCDNSSSEVATLLCDDVSFCFYLASNSQLLSYKITDIPFFVIQAEVRSFGYTCVCKDGSSSFGSSTVDSSSSSTVDTSSSSSSSSSTSDGSEPVNTSVIGGSTAVSSDGTTLNCPEGGVTCTDGKCTCINGSGSKTSGGAGAVFKPVMMIGMALAAFALVF